MSSLSELVLLPLMKPKHFTGRNEDYALDTVV
jgi:hypothetical protein